MYTAPPPKITIQRVSSELWGTALFTSDLWSVADPVLSLVGAEDGSAVRWGTEVRALWSSIGLAVRFRCHDSDPWATLSKRDAPLWREEVVEVFLGDPNGGRDEYFELEVNPLGALFDARVRNPSGDRTVAPLHVDPAWSCKGILWGVGRERTGKDWWAVFALPWSGLEAREVPRQLRANFYRVERPRDPDAVEELSAWSPPLRAPADFHLPSRFGTLLLAP